MGCVPTNSGGYGGVVSQVRGESSSLQMRRNKGGFIAGKIDRTGRSSTVLVMILPNSGLGLF